MEKTGEALKFSSEKYGFSVKMIFLFTVLKSVFLVMLT